MMQMELITLDVTQEMLKALEKKIYQKSHVKNNPQVRENIAKSLTSALKIVEENVRPRAVYRLLPILEIGKDSVMTRAGSVDSWMFSSQVNKSTGNRHIVFMVATLGPALENSVDARHDILSQWVYDLVGSEFMEIVADEVERRVEEDLAKQRLDVARRFSPGYCDWPLNGQRVVFKAVDAEKIDVKLTSHYMMMPRKSISCIMASAEKVPVKIQCLLCSKKECSHRRRPADN